MRLLRLTAAGLIAVSVAVAAVARGSAYVETAVPQPSQYTCSATDKKFIREARLNMVAVGSAGRDYVAGKGRARDVIADADRAAAVVAATRPTDPTLKRTRVLMSTMFREYGNAIRARSRNRAAAPHMYRAYGLANFAHEILTAAEPELRRRGCDVSGLM